MNKLEQYAEQIAMIQGRCDGGRSYLWKEAAKDMSAVLMNIKQYHPRSRGNRLIRILLLQEAELWVNNWTRESLS